MWIPPKILVLWLFLPHKTSTSIHKNNRAALPSQNSSPTIKKCPKPAYLLIFMDCGFDSKNAYKCLFIAPISSKGIKKAFYNTKI